MVDIRNIEKDWITEPSPRGEFTYRELSGERLGARIEELEPGGTSSYHHYHTAEEEHVLVLTGTATLVMDSGSFPLTTGDHVVFHAGDDDAHHIENTSDTPLRFLVYGERNNQDVVFYPDHQVMLVKNPEFRQYTYRPIRQPDAAEDSGSDAGADD